MNSKGMYRLLGILAVTVGLVAATGLTTSAGAALDAGGASEIEGCGVKGAGAFSHSTTIDNAYFPLPPGTRFVLEGRASRTGAPLPHQVIFTVTDVTKLINGVRSVVVLDQDIQDGELVEEELSFWAQDDAGTVWNMGEYPEEYEAGVFLGAPLTWLDGVDGAVGGVHMLADLAGGADFYLQGSAPSVEFLDCARINATDGHECAPTGCYDGVVVTVETSPLAGSAQQLKYHAPGVGIFKVAPIDDPEGEDLVLVERRLTTQSELAQARAQTLKLDRRGYDVSPDVYGTTPKAEGPASPAAGGDDDEADEGGHEHGDDDDHPAPPAAGDDDHGDDDHADDPGHDDHDEGRDHGADGADDDDDGDDDHARPTKPSKSPGPSKGKADDDRDEDDDDDDHARPTKPSKSPGPSKGKADDDRDEDDDD